MQLISFQLKSNHSTNTLNAKHAMFLFCPKFEKHKKLWAELHQNWEVVIQNDPPARVRNDWLIFS